MPHQKTHTIRIIAGRYKGRRLPVVTANALRPTTSRLRETFFNWLQNDIRDAVCLDLFAGSGAMGIEALSRGAKQVTFVDNNPTVTAELRQNLTRLELTENPVFTKSAEKWLITPPETPFDIVFLDPPYQEKTLLFQTLDSLNAPNYLKNSALITLESSYPLPLHPAYQCVCQKKTKNIHYGLYRKAGILPRATAS